MAKTAAEALALAGVAVVYCAEEAQARQRKGDPARDRALALFLQPVLEVVVRPETARPHRRPVLEHHDHGRADGDGLAGAEIETTDAPSPTVSIWMCACSRDASGSSTRTWHFDDRPTVTTPRGGSGCEKNASARQSPKRVNTRAASNDLRMFGDSRTEISRCEP